MNRYSTEPSAWEKISGTTTLSNTQASVIKQTYFLLGIAVLCAMAGGYIGSTSETVLRFLTSKIGFIVALVFLNVVPWVAMACRTRRRRVSCGFGAFAGSVLRQSRGTRDDSGGIDDHRCRVRGDHRLYLCVEA